MTIHGLARVAGVVLVGFLVASASAAQSESKYKILASGEPGRTYHDQYAPNLIDLLPSFHIRNRVTKGSVENLDLLADRKADLAFIQADVYAARLRLDPDRYASLTVVGRLAAECIYIAHRVPGPVASLAALGSPSGDRKAKIAVGPEGGGMSGTWRLMASLDPRLAGAEVVNTGGTLALNQLSIGMLDAVGWVTDPHNLDHVLLRAVNANSELALLAIDAPELEHRLEDGTPIYELSTVDVTSGRNADQIQTICTSAMIFAAPDANPRLVEATSEVLSLRRDKLLRSR